jgi:transposase
MGKPYSSDLRHRFVAALDEGMSASAAGRRMRIARSTAVRWAAIWRKEGRAEALPMGGDRRSEALEAHAETILGWVAETPDLFLNEIAARLAAEGIESSESGISRLLNRHGVTRKKRQWSRRNSRGKTSPKPGPRGATRCPALTPQS